MKTKEAIEYEAVYGTKKLFCVECRKRTSHEYEAGEPASSWRAATPGVWYCLDCGAANGSS